MKARHMMAALVASAIALTACGAPSVPGQVAPSASISSPAVKSGSLTILTKFAAPEYAPYFEAVVKSYMAENPEVTIDLQQVGDQPYKDKIRVLSASKQLPDIYFSWAGDFANKFVRAGLAADLSAEIAPSTSWGSTFAPAALEAFTTGGKQYGVPINLDAKYLVYSKAALAKAGITAPAATLEDLLADCGKLKSAGYTPIAFGNQYGWPAIHYMTQLNAFNVPADTLAKDYNPASGEFTDPGYIKALEQFKQLLTACFNNGANGMSHEVAQANLTSGKAAMQYVELVEFGNFTAEKAPQAFADDWSFFRLPMATGSAGSPNALTGAPDGFMVNAGSENASVAVDFLKYMTNQTNAEKITKDIGWLSPVKGSATEANAFPQLIEALADVSKAESFAIWLDTVAHADVASAYLSGVEGIVSGSKTPEDVMASVKQAAAKAKKSVS
ncbi:MAG: extracellular solute-binding protein [Micropruina sp.]|nr:extracellular solute-binding protein [Micropruina sp.]